MLGGDGAARAGAAFHDDRLPQLLLERFGDDAGQRVGRGARGIRVDDGDRLGGIGVAGGVGRGRVQGQQQGGDAAKVLHDFPSWSWVVRMMSCMMGMAIAE
ncbi:hypothetical protein D3C71_1278810 [compost metagenome]